MGSYTWEKHAEPGNTKTFHRLREYQHLDSESFFDIMEHRCILLTAYLTRQTHL